MWRIPNLFGSGSTSPSSGRRTTASSCGGGPTQRRQCTDHHTILSHTKALGKRFESIETTIRKRRLLICVGRSVKTRAVSTPSSDVRLNDRWGEQDDTRTIEDLLKKLLMLDDVAVFRDTEGSHGIFTPRRCPEFKPTCRPSQPERRASGTGGPWQQPSVS